MINNDTKRLLNSVGKKIFIEYYEDFRNLDIDKSIFAERLLRENTNAHSIGGQKVRINCAQRIFINNLQGVALNIILQSKRIDHATKSKAKRYLEME